MVIKCFLVLLGKGFDLNVALNTEKKNQRKKERIVWNLYWLCYSETQKELAKIIASGNH